MHTLPLVHLRDGREALQLPDGALLSVPPMHPGTSPTDRAQILDLVERRQFGLALDLARDIADDIEHATPERKRLAALMAQTPHKNARGHAAAA